MPPPSNLLNFAYNWLTCRHLRKAMCKAGAHTRRYQLGFSSDVGAEATLRLEERERCYAQAFDEHIRKEESTSVDSRLAELLEALPMLKSLSSRQDRLDKTNRRRYDALDRKMDALAATIERLAALQKEEDAPPPPPPPPPPRRRSTHSGSTTNTPWP